MKTLQRLIMMAGIALGVAAVSQQLKKPPEERDWQGTVAGVVPYDLRIPTPSRIRERWWNPDDPRLFTPHVFGIGWSLNLYQLVQRCGCCGSQEDEQGAA